MARTISKAKNSRVNRTTAQVPATDVSAYWRDLDKWPRSWMGLEKDLLPGEQLLACFRPIIEHLASSNLSLKTIRRHVDNLRMLGGEIIRDLNCDPSRRKVVADRLLCDVIHAGGRPLIHNGSEEEQRSFDKSCRKVGPGYFRPAKRSSSDVVSRRALGGPSKARTPWT
jgi:hypothetical protein